MPKVTAKIIFKLPFSLNMEEVGNSSPQSLKKTRSEEIIIYPPVYAPHLAHRKLWQLKTKKPRKTELNKLNCIVIDIRRYFPTIPITDADQKALVTKAKETLYELLTLLRWRGKQLHISVIDVEHFDFRLRLFDTNGNIIDATGMMHLTLPSLPLKSSDWNGICRDLISKNMPELYQTILLDARSVAYHEPRRAVLDAATACEVFIKSFCKTASKNDPNVDPVVYSALTPWNAGVLHYFHEVLKYLFKHSLKEEPDLYRELDCLRKTNNSIKHEGKCQYEDKGKIIQVDSTRATEFINAVDKAIQYTKSLCTS